MADTLTIKWGGTVGPWKATERGSYHEILFPTDESDWFGHNSMHAVAYIDIEIDEAEAIIDARAIAEVPAMVQALREILAAMEVDERLYSLRDPRADAVRAIFARIDGEASSWASAS